MSRLVFRGHIGRRDYAVNTVQPTVSGSAITGQTLTGNPQTWTSTESRITGYAHDWQSADAPDFLNWTGIPAANAITFLQTPTQIGKKLRYGAAAINGDGQAPQFVYSLPTAIVQDAPALPLSITGTPPTSGAQGAPSTFIVSFDGGTGTYTPTLHNAPAGSSVTLLPDGDQATVSLSTASAGSFGGIFVRVSDGSSTSDLTPFTFTVNAAGISVKLTPGSGWGATSFAPLAARGSPGNPGYGKKCGIWWLERQFDTQTGEFIVEICSFAVSTKADRVAVGNEAFGVYGGSNGTIEASVGNGPVGAVPITYDASTRRYSAKVRMDANDFPDGTWLQGNGLRELRVRAVGKNGISEVLQGNPHTYPYSPCSFYFNTNAGGTLTNSEGSSASTSEKWIANNGNDSTGNGTEAQPYLTPARAVTALGQRGKIICKAGTYTTNGVTAAPTDTGQWITFEAAPGIPASSVVINGGGNSNWLVRRTKYRGVTIRSAVPYQQNSAVAFDHCIIDQLEANFRVNSNSPTPPSNRTVLSYYTNNTITNWAFGPSASQLVKDNTIDLINEDCFGNCVVVVGNTLNEIRAQRRQSSPGVNIPDAPGAPHPDTGQMNWGAGQDMNICFLRYNNTMNTGLVNAQGVFLKDIARIERLFVIGERYKLSTDNDGRNPLYKHSGTTLDVGMWYDCVIDGSGKGVPGWGGPTTDVVCYQLVITGMMNGNNSIPASFIQLD